MGYGKRIARARPLVQIDMDYRTVGKNRDIDLGIVGDPGAILGAVLQAASGRLENGQAPGAARVDEAAHAPPRRPRPRSCCRCSSPNSTPIHPYRVAYEINEFLTDDTIYIGDGGDVVTISAQAVRPRRPGQWMDPGALGTLGVGTGFAIAAKLAHPDKEVLCYYGDGSFGMTGLRHGDAPTASTCPSSRVIGNNSAMNQIRYGQIAKYGEERGNVGNLLGDVPFGKFAEMLGGYGEEVREPGADRAGAASAPASRCSACASRRSSTSGSTRNEYAPGTKNQTMYK